MSDLKMSALMALSLLASPVDLTPAQHPAANAGVFPLASKRTSKRHMAYRLAAAPMLEPKGTYVGELQERWQFPSDHLPIGMTIDGLNIASWNVLDAAYMSWVTEKDSQGLKKSMIVDEHIYIGDSKLTVRDVHTASLVLEMISHPTHPHSILSLQECSQPFLKELSSRLPVYFEIISSHGNAVLFDRRHLELIEAKEISGIFKDAPKQTFQDIRLRGQESGQEIRFLNVHLPGDPDKPARFEFAKYISDTFDPALATIAMGDMNFNEIEMADAMEKAFSTRSPFSLSSPYCTNISPFVFNSKAIDHFIVHSPDGSTVTLSSPDEMMRGLDSIVSLLNCGP
jgi:endonuclease/exonuclease/phosphatase family metal-dependent hydrolase